MLRTTGDEGHRRAGAAALDNEPADLSRQGLERHKEILSGFSPLLAGVPDAGVACARIVESEILPRLLVAHRIAPTSAPQRWATEIDHLAQSAIGRTTDPLLPQLHRHIAAGWPIETIMLELLAPAARLLGDWWQEDHCDFIDVTAGLWRLQEAARAVAARAPAPSAIPAGRRDALFAVAPGDSHQFGSLMVEEMFRRAGWDAERSRAQTGGDLLADVARRPFDLLGLTASTNEHVSLLGSLIPLLRAGAANPAMAIMVGGPLFQADPSLVDGIGADGTARDAHLAVVVADAMVEDRMRSHAAQVGHG